MCAHCCVDCSNRWIIIHSVSDSHCIVGIDLLGQLKILTLLEFPLTPPWQTIFNRALSSLANIRQFWLIWIVEITTLVFALIQRKSDLAYCCDIPLGYMVGCGIGIIYTEYNVMTRHVKNVNRLELKTWNNRVEETQAIRVHVCDFWIYCQI